MAYDDVELLLCSSLCSCINLDFDVLVVRTTLATVLVHANLT